MSLTIKERKAIEEDGWNHIYCEDCNRTLGLARNVSPDYAPDFLCTKCMKERIRRWKNG